MNIVRGDNRKLKFVGERLQLLLQGSSFLGSVVLKFNIEVVLSKDLSVFLCYSNSFLLLASGEKARNLSTFARGKSDKTGMVFPQ